MGTWPWRELGFDEFVDTLEDPVAAEGLSPLLGVPACLVHAPALPLTGLSQQAQARYESLACVVVGAPGEWTGAEKAVIDVIAPEAHKGSDLSEAIAEPIGAHPLAATALALLLRATERRTIGEGLHAESAVYSVLQSGPEFATWLAQHRARRAQKSPVPGGTDEDPTADEEAVLVERHGDRLVITLNRPRKHNAFSRSIRDGLTEALAMAATDTEVRIELRGAGPSFCSGGDLDEFGAFADPATAHLTRLTRSPSRLVAGLAGRTTVHLHGSCLGAGIELPAFAGRVVAHPDSRLGLPEIRLGLIPGAGGTVSLPRRIGRHRTALLALTGTPIDAPTALAWGLIDAIADDFHKVDRNSRE